MNFLLGILQVVLISACVVGYMRLATGPGALRRSADVWKESPRRPAMRLMILLWIAVFVVDLFQTRADLQPEGHWPPDFQRYIHYIEGSLVGDIQSLLLNAPLTNLLSFAYLILFPAILFASASIYDRRGEDSRTREVAWSYAVNYLICLPFYFFVPVREPWTFGASEAVALIDLHSWAPLIDVVRPMSGLDNCFPSYHTSLTFSLVLIAFQGGPVRYARWVAVSGFLIILSTVYLGFHWISDLLAGLVAGWVAFIISRRLSLPAAEQDDLTVSETSS